MLYLFDAVFLVMHVVHHKMICSRNADLILNHTIANIIRIVAEGACVVLVVVVWDQRINMFKR